MISMSSDVNCGFCTVNIVDIDDIDGKRDTKVKWIILLISMIKLTILDFEHLVLFDGKILFTQH